MNTSNVPNQHTKASALKPNPSPDANANRNPNRPHCIGVIDLIANHAAPSRGRPQHEVDTRIHQPQRYLRVRVRVMVVVVMVVMVVVSGRGGELIGEGWCE